MLTNEAYIAAYSTIKNAQKPVCTHCGKIGHTIQKCFKLHGFPPGYRTNSSYKPRIQQTLSQAKLQQSQPSLSQAATAIANVYSDVATSHVSATPSVTSGGNTLNLQNFTPQEIQNMIS